MPREYQDVQTTQEKCGGDEGTVQRHPAFVQVKLSRTNGTYKLYGSALPRCDGAIVLEIVRSRQYHSLGRDWYMGESRSLIQVALSAAQFADLITGMNMGSGVPGTLERFNGEGVPQIPHDHETESTRVVEDFKAKIQGAADQLTDVKRRVDNLLTKKALSVADRKELSGYFDRFAMIFRDNTPFAVESFQEAAEKVVTSSKAEIEAFVTGAVQQAGLQALRDHVGDPVMRAALPAKDEP